MNKGKKLYEGKAKIIYQTNEKGLVIQHFKDDATAFNNLKKGSIKNKGAINNAISSYLFQILNQRSILFAFLPLLACLLPSRGLGLAFSALLLPKCRLFDQLVDSLSGEYPSTVDTGDLERAMGEFDRALFRPPRGLGLISSELPAGPLRFLTPVMILSHGAQAEFWSLDELVASCLPLSPKTSRPFPAGPPISASQNARIHP